VIEPVAAPQGEPPTADGPRVDGIEVASYTVPTDTPEGDGTIAWDSTTMVLVAVHAGGPER
jgi:hypothetical protein